MRKIKRGSQGQTGKTKRNFRCSAYIWGNMVNDMQPVEFDSNDLQRDQERGFLDSVGYNSFAVTLCRREGWLFLNENTEEITHFKRAGDSHINLGF